MSAKIIAALSSLDVANNDHWTEDGLPRMDVVKHAAGDNALTREAVTAAAPGFSRATGLQPKPATTPPWVAQAPVQPPEAPAQAPEAVMQPPAPLPPVQDTQESDDASATRPVGAGEAVTQEQPSEPQSGAAETLEGARARLVEAEARKKVADQAHAQAVAEVDRFIEQAAKETPAQALSSSLQHYFESQQRLRAERVQRIEALKGIDIKTLFPQRAPIDQAMSRKNTRGAQRPQAQLIKR